MIEIKNKRMLLYPEDRLIGAEGDVSTAERKFIMDAVQGGFDLSGFVAFIKLESSSGEAPYDQLLKKEIIDGKIILTWNLSGANLKNAGEISAQITLASPDFFNPDDLAALSDSSFVVPSVIEGVSAPVWQSFKETFVVDESIDGTVAYQEVSKNVLTAALAQCAQNVEECQSLQNSVAIMYGSVCENLEASENLASLTDTWAHKASESCDGAEKAAEDANTYSQQAESSAHAALESENAAYAFEQSALFYSQKSEELYEENKKLADKIASTGCYRQIFSKTISEEDAGCVSFEVTQDNEGNALNLIRFAVYAYIPVMTEATASYLRIECKADGVDSYSLISKFSGISRSGNDMYFKAICENEGRWCTKLSKSNSWFQNAESATLYGPICSNDRELDGKMASQIRIRQHSNPIAFPVGTYIEIWGVDGPESEVGANE